MMSRSEWECTPLQLNGVTIVVLCDCSNGLPVISELVSKDINSFHAKHACSNCKQHLYDCELTPGMQLIATRDIKNLTGDYVVPQGRVLRISAFSELPSSNSPGLLFAGLLGVGAFSPQGFATQWDIHKILNAEDQGSVRKVR